MFIGDRLKELRESKKMSQGDIEEKTNLLRAYVSRVENNHTIPAVETLAKFANALNVPLYQLFYEGNEKPPKMESLPRSKRSDKLWGAAGKDARMLQKFRRHLGKAKERDVQLLLHLAQKMTGRGAKQ